MATTLPISSLGNIESTGNNSNININQQLSNQGSSSIPNISKTASLLNLDILIRNTDDVNKLSKLFPFSIEITEKIISYAYYMDAPHVINEPSIYNETSVSKNENISGTYNNNNNNTNTNTNEIEKTKISSTAKNLTLGRFSNLDNLMLVNSGFLYLCRQYQYKYCKFIRSFAFSKFLINLINTNELGDYVEYLDFQEFTAVGLGKSIESIYKIPNLTDVTLLKCLELCNKNLKTLLLSESVDTDISCEILQYIFNNLKNLKSLDFCGFSNDNLTDYFDILTINDNLKIENLSFHECLDFPSTVYDKILKFTPNLKKLDLAHTQVTLKTLNQFLNQNTRLTHLSLRKCSHLGTFQEFLKFLQHPAVCGVKIENEDEEEENINNNNKPIKTSNEISSLRWLNLQQCFSSETLSTERIDTILQILADGAPNLRYLNLNGFANINGDHIKKISENFTELESLSICDVNLDFSNFEDLQILSSLNCLNKLKFLDISSSTRTVAKLKNIIIELRNIEIFEVKPSLTDNLAHVFKLKIYDNLNFNNNYIIDQNDQNEEYWRVFNNKGISRRSWVHRILNNNDNKFYDNYETETSGARLVEWDINTGQLVLNRIKRLNLLGYACVKINCCDDVGYAVQDKDFGNDLSVRGLYKYYSLNM
ncbi:Lug1 protein [Pichia kluyveri]|uniref:Lug1 protein n=1 Tax=Pichia kluyveri TaxID=36015 RepID=A0AAV5R006_PICKL|nr:Lug1 protein [Pichia kluyveri]